MIAISEEAHADIVALLRGLAFVGFNPGLCENCGEDDVWLEAGGQCSLCWGTDTSTGTDALLCLYDLGLVPGDTFTGSGDSEDETIDNYRESLRK